MNPKPTVYVVLLNWNGWRDTIACLESLYASRNVNLRAVVCDNASSDDSMAHISSWAEGLNKVVAPEHPRLSRLLGNITLPLNYKCLDRETAERGDRCDHASLVLVENGDNLGFAAGNNSGIRFALGQPDMDYVWVLNNDTIVEPDCLSNMVSRLEESSEKLVCGSMIHFFDQPEIIQAVGGNRFNRNTGSASMSEGRFTHEEEILDIKV
jgi:GT2 family glycosyltransferase